jgi:YD repeat-containing protein
MNKNSFSKAIIAFLLLIIAPAQMMAQSGACPDIVAAALDSAEQYCLATGRNTLCYGNLSGEATPQEGVTNFRFEQVGDVVSLNDLATLTLEPMDTNNGTWGVALMQLQANLPDTLPGQNVTFILFGDVSLENATETGTWLEMTVSTRGRVRSTPSSDNNQNVIGAIDPNTVVVAYGRDESGRWVRIRYDLGGAWISSEIVSNRSNIPDLPVVDVDAPPPPTPMQAFYFRTGVGDKPCAEAPDSGLLIQTPKGARGVTFTANGVQIGLGSSAYLRFGEGELKMSVVEGTGYITAMGVTQPVPEGTFATVPMSEDGREPIAPPNYPIPYNFEAMSVLPVARAFFQSKIIVPSLPADEIPPAIDAIMGGAPALSGIYNAVITKVESGNENECEDVSGASYPIQFEFVEGGIRTTGIAPLQVFIPQIAEGVYEITLTTPPGPYRNVDGRQYTLDETDTITLTLKSLNMLELISVRKTVIRFVTSNEVNEEFCTTYANVNWYTP